MPDEDSSFILNFRIFYNTSSEFRSSSSNVMNCDTGREEVRNSVLFDIHRDGELYYSLVKWHLLGILRAAPLNRLALSSD